MLKKGIAIFLLSIAQILIFGHDVVPHHHHSVDTETEVHHHTQGGKHEHADDNPLGFAFAHFIHWGEQISFTNIVHQSVSIEKTKKPSTKIFSCEFTVKFNYPVFYQKHPFPPDKQINYLSPYNNSNTLRGPPIFIVS